MKLSYLWHGLPGHPLHPPLTDATIGTYTFATIAALADVLTITWRSELWWTATYHLLSMVTATVFFGLAAIFGHAAYSHGDVSSGSFVLTLIGFGFLMLGGWLGGTVVFEHGMRVLNLVQEPTERAVAPVPHPEKEMAEGG